MSGRVNIEGARAKDMLIHSSNRYGLLELTLVGTYAVPPDSPHYLALDPGGGARTVTLPANPRRGDWYYIINTADAAEIITVQNSAGVGLTPACTPTQNETAFVMYINATLGWRNFVAIGA